MNSRGKHRRLPDQQQRLQSAGASESTADAITRIMNTTGNNAVSSGTLASDQLNIPDKSNVGIRHFADKVPAGIRHSADKVTAGESSYGDGGGLKEDDLPALPRSNLRISLEPHHAVLIILILLCALSLSVTLSVRQGLALVRQARSQESAWTSQQGSQTGSGSAQGEGVTNSPGTSGNTSDSASSGAADNTSSSEGATSQDRGVDNSGSPGNSGNSGNAGSASNTGNSGNTENSGSAQHNADTRIDINAAGVQELDTIPGVGPVLAQRIIDYRAAHGRFASIEELQHVQGIGTKTLEKIRAYIKVGTS